VGGFLLSLLVLVVVFGTLGGWAVREDRRRRLQQQREEVGR
jgi:hypothetical protein